MKFAAAVICTHLAVACLAWAHGYMSHVWMERRNTELDWRQPVPMCDLDDLTDRPAYDWATTTENAEVLR